MHLTKTAGRSTFIMSLVFCCDFVYACETMIIVQNILLIENMDSPIRFFEWTN